MKKKISILIFTAILFIHVFSVICLIIVCLINFSKVYNIDKHINQFVVTKAEIVGQSNSVEYSITTKVIVDGQVFYMENVLESGIYEVWLNKNKNKVHLKQGKETKEQFCSRMKVSYFQNIIIFFGVFLLLSVLNIISFKYIKPLTT